MSCKKKAYNSKLDANMALLLIWRDRPDISAIRSYPCQNHWHITSQNIAGISRKETQNA